MVADRSQPRVGLLSQLTRFVLVGGLSALVDYGLYQALLHTGLWVHGAKALSFVCGTTTAYLLNRRFTFTQTAGGATRFTGFLLLYGTTFFVNVGMNALVLHLITEGAPFRVTIAWVFAQGTATMINFLMLRYVVFRR
ncbi:GtrA family protein [Pseudonocardia eucalypti]|uniref:GtrA family protein n=1 Tax=Pseudonocardia eucalypti TaxID=648755 RepID=A0ABP9QYI1_9PSEU